VRSLTSSFASVASTFKYSAYCVPDGCCVCSENAGDVPWAMEFRSNEPVQPCWLNDGEMKRISSGHDLWWRCG
tara:strand:- start:82 stop:300 length:219 start_codon:yes stop_codon:yes gene_type:complete